MGLRERRGRLQNLPSIAFFIAATVLTSLFPSRVAAQGPGALDATFGVNGIVVTDFGGAEDINAVAIQPDGKIVAAGKFVDLFENTNPDPDLPHTDFLVTRYLADGTLDPFFGHGGVVLTHFVGFDYFTAVVVQADGKIVGAGRSTDNCVLVRYLADGSLDAEFGIGGIVVSDFGLFEQFSALTLQADGKLVATGEAKMGGTFAQVLARYNANGTPDASFGGGTGVTLSDFGGPLDVALAPDGKIVVVESSSSPKDFVLARFKLDGALDATFGVGGLVTTEFTGDLNVGARAVAIQSDGKIVAAGHNAAGDVLLARYNPDGTLDTTFGSQGLVVSGLNVWEVNAMALQPDNKILVAGTAPRSLAARDFMIARYLVDGTLDSHFGDRGIVTTDLDGGSFDEGRALALQADGKAVVAGRSAKAGFDGIALARYLTADTSEPRTPLLIATPSVLWPPDHKMRSVTIATYAADGGPFGPGCSISDVTSSEGGTVPGFVEWQITGPMMVDLRADRGGFEKQGRVYTLVVSCPTSPPSATVTVRVPHDQSKSQSK